MSAQPLPAHPLNRLGTASLIAVLAYWIGFHFRSIDGEIRGWEVWKQLWEIVRRLSLPQSKSMMAISPFLTIAVLVTASPFLPFLLRASKLCHWVAIIASGSALLGWGS